MSISVLRDRAKDDGKQMLSQRIAELAAQRRRFGYRRVRVLLLREDWMINLKPVYRLYCEAGDVCGGAIANASVQPGACR